MEKWLDKFERFVEVYLIIASTMLIISFIYNIIKRSM